MTPVFISSDQEEYKLGNKAGQALLLHLPSLFTDIKKSCWMQLEKLSKWYLKYQDLSDTLIRKNEFSPIILD